MRDFLKSTWNKVAATAVVVSALAFGGVHVYKYMSDDCCAEGAPCCQPGAPCCATHNHGAHH